MHARLRFPVGVAVIAVLIAAGPAAGARVRFDNPAGPEHFIWAEPGSSGDIYVSRSPASQFPNTTPVPDLFLLGTDAALTVGTVTGLIGGQVQNETGGGRLAPLSFGQTIPTPGLTWQQFGRVTSPESPSLFPEGVETYFGVVFTLNDGVHFGWIGVVRNAAMLDAFAWGYETAPFTPIAAGAPEPATVGMVALGVLGSVLGGRGVRRTGRTATAT